MGMATNPETSEVSKLASGLRISEGWALALIPALAYLLTYAYTSAYFAYFGVPESAVSVDFASLLETSALLLAVVFVIAMVLYIIHPLWLIVLTVVLLIAVIAYAAIESREVLLIVGASLIIPAMIYFLVVWRKWFGELRKNLGNRPAVEIALPYPGISDYNPASTGTLAIIVRAFGIKAPTVFAILFFIVLYGVADTLARFVGTQRAANTHWFQVNEQHPNWFIVGRSGDRWVCAKVDYDKPTLVVSYAFLAINSDNVTWRWTRLGTLHAAHNLDSR